MPENQPENLNSQAVPFFARFLEGQNYEDLSDQESEAVSGGAKYQTKKYPSDKEDGGFVTDKCGSDNDVVTTQKYPSDNDEDSELVTTLKYPSDGEDS